MGRRCGSSRQPTRRLREAATSGCTFHRSGASHSVDSIKKSHDREHRHEEANGGPRRSRRARRECGQQRRRRALHSLEEEWLADAARLQGHGEAFPTGLSQSRRDVHHHAGVAVVDRLQYQPRQTGRRARMVKGHPAHSGTIMTTTFQLIRELGWEYLEGLAKQRVMQVKSSTDPPKKLALGERAVMADGNEYNIVLLKEAGRSVEPVYPTEGTPTISGPTGIFASAPQRGAAVSGVAAHPGSPAVPGGFLDA